MSQSKRLLFYLALNVLVSACTALTILYLWTRANPSSFPALFPVQTEPAALTADATSQPLSLTPVAATPEAAASPEPDEAGSIILIDNIFGAGDLANEVVVVKRAGSGALSLTGWQLSGDDGQAFTFPSLVLYTDGAVQVHTSAGVNSVVDLYWGLDSAIWQSGETVTLLDPQGQVFATYRIP